jgi:hypothetical protein
MNKCNCQMPGCGEESSVGMMVHKIQDDRLLDFIFEYCTNHKYEEIQLCVNQIIEKFCANKTKGCKLSHDNSSHNFT